MTSAMFGSRGTENLSTLATATVEACYDEGLGILAAVASQKPRVQQEVSEDVCRRSVSAMSWCSYALHTIVKFICFPV